MWLLWIPANSIAHLSEYSSLQDVCKNYFMVSFVKQLFDSVDKQKS